MAMGFMLFARVKMEFMLFARVKMMMIMISYVYSVINQRRLMILKAFS